MTIESLKQEGNNNETSLLKSYQIEFTQTDISYGSFDFKDEPSCSIALIKIFPANGFLRAKLKENHQL